MPDPQLQQPSLLQDPEFRTYVSVDVEAAGPNPGLYSLLSLGACLVANPERAFYVELQPVNARMTAEAQAIHGLTLEELAKRGLPPAEAMARFAAWLTTVIPQGQRPLFVAFNAPFDWMFVNDYFHRYLGHNPFGHAALDIKSFYMGLGGVPWRATSMRTLARRYPLAPQGLSHHALQDARHQAQLFRRLLALVTASPDHHL